MRDIHHSRGWGGTGENGLKACFNQQQSQSRSHNWNGKRAYHQVKNKKKSELGEIISSAEFCKIKSGQNLVTMRCKGQSQPKINLHWPKSKIF